MSPTARLVGINHVALEVGDLEEALSFYGQLFEVELRGRVRGMAFIDIGDQFIALSEGRNQSPDEGRHFGLVVDDRAAFREALDRIGAEVLPGRGLDFRDPWGNHVQVVEYADVQFTKASEVLGGMGLEGLEKSPQARRELRDKELADPDGANVIDDAQRWRDGRYARSLETARSASKALEGEANGHADVEGRSPSGVPARIGSFSVRRSLRERVGQV